MGTENKNRNILCIIPARGGSKGVKRKNIRGFNGKPLIAWTIDEAKKSEYIGRIVVSTEDSEISDISRDFGAQVIRRPDELARDSSTTVDVLLHVVEVLKEEGYDPDIIVLLQCTSPLRTVNHIDEAVKYFLNNEDRAESLISVAKQEHPPWWLKTINDRGYLDDFIKYDKIKFTRRQDFPEVYYFNGAIYIIKADVLKTQKALQAGRTLAYKMDFPSSIDIDTEMDFVIAEYLAQHGSRNAP